MSDNSVLGAIDALVQEIQQEKTASAMPADPGGHDGPSSHPSAKEDNGGHPATEGEQSADNEKRVKEDQGPAGVNNATPAKDGTQKDVQPNIGTTQSAVGEDPSIEDDYKSGKDDPGTSHPARTDNESLDGNKYASCSRHENLRTFTDVANDILADLAVNRGSGLGKQAQAQAQASAEDVANLSKEAGLNPEGVTESLLNKAASSLNEDGENFALGYKLAKVAGATLDEAKRTVADTAESMIKAAYENADLVGQYIYATLEKQAMDPTEGENHEEESGSGAEEAAVDEGANSDPLEEAAPAGDIGSELGGSSLEDMISGAADPMAEPPMEEMGGLGEMGGEPSQEEVLAELVAALQELNIAPEELAAAGPPAEEPGGMTQGMKFASAVKNFCRSGKYEFKSANAGTSRRDLRNKLKSHIVEMINHKK